MIKSLLSKLTSLLRDGGSIEQISGCESFIIDSIDVFLKKDDFYELPTNEILYLTRQSNIDNIDTLKEFISKMISIKGNWSTLLLSVIDPKDKTLEECINIIAQFTNCPICKRIEELYRDNEKLVDRDYDYEISILKKEIENLEENLSKTNDLNEECIELITTLKEQNEEYNKIITALNEKNEHLNSYIEALRRQYERRERALLRTTPKTVNYDSDIWHAAQKGDLGSIKYLIEQCSKSADSKDTYGMTPLNYAAANGHLSVVKYLTERCYAYVETKDRNYYTPVISAAFYGHLDVVRYLYERYHVNVNAREIKGYTAYQCARSQGHYSVASYLSGVGGS